MLTITSQMPALVAAPRRACAMMMSANKFSDAEAPPAGVRRQCDSGLRLDGVVAPTAAPEPEPVVEMPPRRCAGAGARRRRRASRRGTKGLGVSAIRATCRASRSSRSSSLENLNSAPAYLDGSMPGDKGFDPWGLIALAKPSLEMDKTSRTGAERDTAIEGCRRRSARRRSRGCATRSSSTRASRCSPPSAGSPPRSSTRRRSTSRRTARRRRSSTATCSTTPSRCRRLRRLRRPRVPQEGGGRPRRRLRLRSSGSRPERPDPVRRAPVRGAQRRRHDRVQGGRDQERPRRAVAITGFAVQEFNGARPSSRRRRSSSGASARCGASAELDCL